MQVLQDCGLDGKVKASESSEFDSLDVLNSKWSFAFEDEQRKDKSYLSSMST